MNISELSIKRPVLATVMTLVILLFGAIGYMSLGVREYPSVDNPIISVSCSYPGANADVIETGINIRTVINDFPVVGEILDLFISKTGFARQARIASTVK